jgi:hypothetical protein
VVVLVCLIATLARSTWAYVEIPYTLGRVMQEASFILVMRVEKVDKQKNLILFRKVRDLKGTFPQDVIRHNIGTAGFHPRESQTIMAWAEPGQTAIFFHNGGASETCIGGYWYQAYAGGEWWNMSHGEPYLLRSFAGKADKLEAAVTAMLAGQEVVVPCMVDGNKEALQLRTAKVQRMKASLKIQDYNAQRDFVGWGGEDFRAVEGMPAFSHLGSVNRTDPEAGGVATADFDGDGKPDVCLFGSGKVALLQVQGTSLNEVALPLVGGARTAAWADYNGDKLPDLLLGTASGPKLLTNQGKGVFKDDSNLIPREPYYNLRSAAWIDADADGLPDIVVGNGFLGLRLYRNQGKAEIPIAPPADPAAPVAAPATPPLPLWFGDVTAKFGLDAARVPNPVRADTVLVGDLNADGKQDFLVTGADVRVMLNAGATFQERKDAGLKFTATGSTPLIADLNGDKHLDLFVPLPDGSCKLFRNDGKAQFTDVTAASGAISQPLRFATSAATVSTTDPKRTGLIVGCLRGPNRFFRNDGSGKFVEATVELGLHQKVFNSRGVSALDLNVDGAVDLVFNNEGQESTILLGRAVDPKVAAANR